jgi:hypothetical protein
MLPDGWSLLYQLDFSIVLSVHPLSWDSYHGMWHKRLRLQSLSGDVDCRPFVSGNDTPKHILPSANAIQRIVSELRSSNQTG